MSVWQGVLIALWPFAAWLLVGAPTSFMSQRHEFRGLSYAADLLDRIFVMGWVTIWFSRRPLIDRLRELLSASVRQKLRN